MRGKLMVAILFFCVVGVESKFKFGEMTTIPIEGSLFSGQKTIANNAIYVIEKDLRKEGNVLVSTINTIFSLSLDNDTSADRLIAGSVTGYTEGVGANAQFGKITGIIQQENSMLVVDCDNHCLRKLDVVVSIEEETWESTKFAGMCGEKGDTDGRRQNVRFSSPWSIVKDESILYVADSGNAQIKKLDLVTNLVTSVYETAGFPPYGLALGKNEDEFYVTVPHGVLYIKDQTETWLVGSATGNKGDSKGKFSVVGFYSPKQIKWLDDTTLIVADDEVDTVKVIDLQQNEVRAICKGPGNVDGNLANCQLENPRALIVDEGEIFVGCKIAAGGLKYIEYVIVDSDGGLKLNCKTPPQLDHAEHTNQEKYPIGTEIEYSCLNRYVNRGTDNTRSVCVNGGDNGAVWSDVDIMCQLSAEMIAVVVLTVLLFVVIGVLALVIFFMRKRNTDENYTEPIAEPQQAHHQYNPPPPTQYYTTLSATACTENASYIPEETDAPYDDEFYDEAN